VTQRLLDHERACMLAVDVGDFGAEIRRRDELVDRRMDEHAGGVNA